MKKTKYLLQTLSSLALLAIALAVLYVVTYTPPQREPSAEVVEATPARLARGEYLVQNVLLCVNCHSERDWTVYGAPAKAPFGQGRECLGRDGDVPGLDDAREFPGIVCFRNITGHDEAGIGTWSDGEVLRAMREGIGKDGRALFPIMPSFIYRNLSDDDARAVVAYVRTFDPIDNKQPDSQINFPVSVFINRLPQPLDGPVESVDPSDRVRYGEYLSTIARCGFCHTPTEGQVGRPIPGMNYAGGTEFNGPGGRQVSSNLTPHATGLGDMSRAEFIALFKQYEEPMTVARDANTLMSWTSYGGMTEADLGAIYDFLQTLEPVDNVAE